MILLFVWSQASVARLEQQLADCESALVEEKVVSEDRKHQAEQCQYQVDIIESLKALYCVSFLYFCWLAWKKIASRVHIWSILLFINTIININKEVILYCFKNHPWHINGCKLSPKRSDCEVECFHEYVNHRCHFLNTLLILEERIGHLAREHEAKLSFKMTTVSPTQLLIPLSSLLMP